MLLPISFFFSAFIISEFNLCAKFIGLAVYEFDVSIEMVVFQNCGWSSQMIMLLALISNGFHLFQNVEVEEERVDDRSVDDLLSFINGGDGGIWENWSFFH